MKKIPEIAKKKIPEVAKRIRKLRKALGKGQVQFAKSLGVSQATVSSWELGKKTPSRAWYLQFWALALDPDLTLLPDRDWFWRRVGNYRRRVLAFTQAIWKKSGALSVEDQIIRVRCFRRTAQGNEDTGRLLPLPAESQANAASTICLVVDETAASPMFQSGDLILLDTSDNKAKDLSPFWQKMVLIDISGTRPWSININPLGLSMGQLRCKVFEYSPYPMPGQFLRPWWVAVVSPFNDCGNRWRGPIDEGIDIGRWDPFLDEKPSSARETDDLEAEGWKRAASEIRLDEPCHILGRVLGWFRPPRE
jgi:DNA-binding XRE family transcriptional regulator